MTVFSGGLTAAPAVVFLAISDSVVTYDGASCVIFWIYPTQAGIYPKSTAMVRRYVGCSLAWRAWRVVRGQQDVAGIMQRGASCALMLYAFWQCLRG